MNTPVCHPEVWHLTYMENQSETSLVIVAIAAAVPPTLAAIAAFVSSMRNQHRLEHVKQQLDGRLTQLLNVTRDLALAKGAELERATPGGQPIAPLPDRLLTPEEVNPPSRPG